MSWNLPPLPALKAFEATVRCGTMTMAAKELCISQVAVSKQVARLEHSLRTSLFLRGGKRLQLTPDGEKLYAAMSLIFHQLQTVTEEIGGKGYSQVLNIVGYSNFTMKWLIPRLKHFCRKYPSIDIRLTSSLKEVDFDRSNFDAAIRSGDGNWKDCEAVELVPIELVPICSPEIAEKLRETGPGGLQGKILLHSVARPDDWQTWLSAANVKDIDPHSGITFNNGSIAYQASIEGIGISIAQKILILDDVDKGRLAIPFNLPVSSGESYWFVWPKTRGSSKLSIFRKWLENDAIHPLATEKY